MLYHIKFDENNYVIDLTRLSPAPPEYVLVDIADIPHDVMCGYYQLIDGIFVLDEAKKAEYDAANQPSELL